MFIQFSEKLLPNNTFLPQTQGLVPPSGIPDPLLHRNRKGGHRRGQMKGNRRDHREGTWGIV